LVDDRVSELPGVSAASPVIRAVDAVRSTHQQHVQHVLQRQLDTPHHAHRPRQHHLSVSKHSVALYLLIPTLGLFYCAHELAVYRPAIGISGEFTRLLRLPCSLNSLKNKLHVLWSPYVIRQTIIFLPCYFFLSFFFPHLISAAVGWMSTIL